MEMKFALVILGIMLLQCAFMACRISPGESPEQIGQKAALMNNRIRELAEKYHGKTRRWPSSIRAINMEFPADSFAEDLTSPGARLEINPSTAEIVITRQDDQSCSYDMTILGIKTNNIAEE
jgi:hypothetical protein